MKLILMSMIMKAVLLFVAINLSTCSKNENFECYLDQKSQGPCVIFLHPKVSKVSKYVLIDEGFAKANPENFRSKFIFKDNTNKEIIPAIAIGDETSADSSQRYIFGLTKNNAITKCMSEEIESITFFYGTRDEYMTWSDKHPDYFEYYELQNKDWCKYYKSIL